MNEGSGSRIYRIIGIVMAVVAVAGLAVWVLWLAPARRQAHAPPPEVAAPTAVPAPTPTLQERLSERLQGVTLLTSDAAVRELVAALSAHPELAKWLASEDLVRGFTATVNNIAEGTSPRPHLSLLRPAGTFRVIERDGVLTVDPRSWRRYDLVADVFVSLDTAGTVALYRELRPLVDEAHREIARPGLDFDGRLLAAIDHLLQVPVIEGDVQVTEKVVTFTYANDALEGLSDAQRHLLRMGPENVRRVQAKLRELKAALLAPTAVPAEPEVEAAQ